MVRIVIEIPDNEIPTRQEIVEVGIHFIDGKVCECTYPFQELPKNHGDLIDRNKLLDCSYEIDSFYCLYDLVVSVDDVKDAPTIIEAEVKADV